MFFPKTIFWGCSFPKNVILGETANSQNCFLGSRLPKIIFSKIQFWGNVLHFLLENIAFPKTQFWENIAFPKTHFWEQESAIFMYNQ